MLSLAEARVAMLDGVVRLGTETVGVADCSGRILAADIVADRDQPAVALSAMDGYAIRSADVAAQAILHVIGSALAGEDFTEIVGRGEAVRIATGGCVPAGADRVIIQEQVTRDGDVIRIDDASSMRTHIRPAGGDFRAGQVVALAGASITPACRMLIAATNTAEVAVARRPRVAIVPSGDELREPGSPLGDAQIVNSGVFAIADLVERWGAVPLRQPILPDALDACLAQLRACDLDVDVIVTLGGASVGDHDSLRPAFDALGAELKFDRIAVIPGKPSWHARFPDGRLVVGLPGNPASAFVCAHLLLKPLLFGLIGRDPADATATVKAMSASDLPATGPREAFLRATVTVGEDGRLRAATDARQDSSMITPLIVANGLVRRPVQAPAIAVGETVELLLLAPPYSSSSS